MNRSKTKRKRKGPSSPVLDDSPKRTKVHAQRKFAQGSNVPSPVITPIKELENEGPPIEILPEPVELMPIKRPNTEDFLTFLCFRGTPLLPQSLNFFNTASIVDTNGQVHKIKAESPKNGPIDSTVISKGGPSTDKPFIAFGVRKRADPIVISRQMDRKRRHALALQALRRKYQEQKMAKIRALTISKLSEKVTNKTMVRTNSISKTETVTKKTNTIQKSQNVKVIATKHVKVTTRTLKTTLRPSALKQKMCLRSFRGRFVQKELPFINKRKVMAEKQKRNIQNNKKENEGECVTEEETTPAAKVKKIVRKPVVKTKTLTRRTILTNPKKPPDLNSRITRSGQINNTLSAKIQKIKKRILLNAPKTIVKPRTLRSTTIKKSVISQKKCKRQKREKTMIIRKESVAVKRDTRNNEKKNEGNENTGKDDPINEAGTKKSSETKKDVPKQTTEEGKKVIKKTLLKKDDCKKETTKRVDTPAKKLDTASKNDDCKKETSKKVDISVKKETPKKLDASSTKDACKTELSKKVDVDCKKEKSKKVDVDCKKEKSKKVDVDCKKETSKKVDVECKKETSKKVDASAKKDDIKTELSKKVDVETKKDDSKKDAPKKVVGAGKKDEFKKETTKKVDEKAKNEDNKKESSKKVEAIDKKDELVEVTKPPIKKGQAIEVTKTTQKNKPVAKISPEEVKSGENKISESQSSKVVSGKKNKKAEIVENETKTNENTKDIVKSKNETSESIHKEDLKTESVLIVDKKKEVEKKINEKTKNIIKGKNEVVENIDTKKEMEKKPNEKTKNISKSKDEVVENKDKKKDIEKKTSLAKNTVKSVEKAAKQEKASAVDKSSITNSEPKVAEKKRRSVPKLVIEEVSKSCSQRPSRKSKEAAAIYMEILSHKLVHDSIIDDDNVSIDSFPELPNVKKMEQRENELKAKHAKDGETEVAGESKSGSKNTQKRTPVKKNIAETKRNDENKPTGESSKNNRNDDVNKNTEINVKVTETFTKDQDKHTIITKIVEEEINVVMQNDTKVSECKTRKEENITRIEKDNSKKDVDSSKEDDLPLKATAQIKRRSLTKRKPELPADTGSCDEQPKPKRKSLGRQSDTKKEDLITEDNKRTTRNSTNKITVTEDSDSSFHAEVSVPKRKRKVTRSSNTKLAKNDSDKEVLSPRRFSKSPKKIDMKDDIKNNDSDKSTTSDVNLKTLKNRQKNISAKSQKVKKDGSLEKVDSDDSMSDIDLKTLKNKQLNLSPKNSKTPKGSIKKKGDSKKHDTKEENQQTKVESNKSQIDGSVIKKDSSKKKNHNSDESATSDLDLKTLKNRQNMCEKNKIQKKDDPVVQKDEPTTLKKDSIIKKDEGSSNSDQSTTSDVDLKTLKKRQKNKKFSKTKSMKKVSADELCSDSDEEPLSKLTHKSVDGSQISTAFEQKTADKLTKRVPQKKTVVEKPSEEPKGKPKRECAKIPQNYLPMFSSSSEDEFFHGFSSTPTKPVENAMEKLLVPKTEPVEPPPCTLHLPPSLDLLSKEPRRHKGKVTLSNEQIEKWLKESAMAGSSVIKKENDEMLKFGERIPTETTLQITESFDTQKLKKSLLIESTAEQKVSMPVLELASPSVSTPEKTPTKIVDSPSKLLDRKLIFKKKDNKQLPNANAFSPENESSVYAFGEDAEPLVSTPFRRPSRRPSSTATSRSEDESARLDLELSKFRKPSAKADAFKPKDDILDSSQADSDDRFNVPLKPKGKIPKCDSPMISKFKSRADKHYDYLDDFKYKVPSSPSASSSSSAKLSKRNNSKGKNRASEVLTPIHLPEFPKDACPGILVEAPVFYPTDQEFQDPIEYIERVRHKAEPFGICKIVPPNSFKPECKIQDDMRFTAYNQYVQKMFNRWGPNFKELMAIKKYLETQSITLTQPPWIGGVEIDLPRLYQTVQTLGGLKEVIEKKKWPRVSELMKIPKSAQDRVTKLDDIYCKYLLPYDTLSPDEREKLFDEVETEWAKRESKGLLRAQQKGPTEKPQPKTSKESSDTESDNDIEECTVKGKNMALNGFYRIARNTMAMYFKGTEPTPEEVEQEYWKQVSAGTQHICVHSGSIDSGGSGCGFSVSKNSPFARHAWNLKVLTNSANSLLRSLGPIMGVTVPTVHVGMVFTACCWYRDPHGLPWIEYLHTGGSKIWYAIPDSNSEKFHETLKKLVPNYCRNKLLWLPSDTTMVPPHLLTENNVSMSRLVQEPGQFVVVFPHAFTSSVSSGYVVSESVYFAPANWLKTARHLFRQLRSSCEPSMFSLDRLVLSVAADSRTSVEVLRLVTPYVEEICDTEKAFRSQLRSFGITLTEKMPLPEAPKKRKRAHGDDGDYECEICRLNLFVSMIFDTKGDMTYCIEHSIELLSAKKIDAQFCKFMFTYDDEELNGLTEKIQKTIEFKTQKRQPNKFTGMPTLLAK